MRFAVHLKRMFRYLWRSPSSESVFGEPAPQAWWKVVTRYQWIVLLVATLGWVFDIFEGQIFVTAMREMMDSSMPQATEEEWGRWASWGSGRS